ncbi:IclR family transcriptional regulator [Moorella thermoacetica]|uniref:Glycerol operon regulatory protein n=1 Tax=Moorella thermoacetica (strain ATCC 39073 / JCM 9320) TaxID=264732 RepID=Q2RLI0_MOOTA|nr:IclR family transcriptional regulator [Moorella thermoacetica]AKX93118.1 transcriptional regulator KdgR [Moorella thermoacetica]AKX95768.1 transcriptional regulator KdgR [Moorella thermoacetica]OIQ54603.1 transcriptional regulator KdgR [Moorella thermoacetica]QCZ99578.1 Transcriptional regulator KdgR [Moorella thermoacetica]TYL07238.1 Transcriptional regulator KdgR [Moorella thermoacetica]
MAKEKYILQSVDNALRILEAFSANEPELGISELSRKLGLSKSAVFRLVLTLQSRGFLSQDPVTGKYLLGLKTLYLGGLVLKQMDLVKIARTHLEELVKKSAEVAHLVVLEQGEAVFIGKVESQRPMMMGSYVGARMPAYCTATGKVLLAHLPSEELENYLRNTTFTRFTSNTITNPEKLREHLISIRTQGYAVDKEESEEGLFCIAAPVKDNGGKVLAAISISGPAGRLEKRWEEFRELVISAAENISRSLGWN